MNAEKNLGLFWAESVSIGMKLELHLWRSLLNVYYKFQIHISEHVEKSSENFEKSKTPKNNRQNSENKVFE